MTKTTDNKPTVTMSKSKQNAKASIVETLLERKDGATHNAIGKATGWQTGSSRAFLSGVRTKGREVVRYQDDKGASICNFTRFGACGANA